MNNKQVFEKIIVRVYALIVYEQKILVSDEFWYDTPMTKFPGGGLKPGEGIIDCLHRELFEELNAKVTETEHFFTYEHFIPSDFTSKTQIIPVYYLVNLQDYSCFHTSDYRYDFKKLQNGAISLRWVNLSELKESELTFIGDKTALVRYKKQFNFPNGI